MHVPDGFLDLTTSVATGVVAAGAVGLALRRAAPEIRETGPALPGLTAAFVFAVQMVNFPVGAGTSGHLLGGALAAALVGPWSAILVMTGVLLVQAVMFADGGLTALGTNVLLMGLVGVLVGHLVMRAALAVLPRRPGSAVPAACAGAFLSVPAAALAFAGLYAVGGTVDLPVRTVVTAMVGWHLLIGIGEAVITGAVLGAVVASRPDLVHVTRPLRPRLEVVDTDGTRRTVTADPVGSHGARQARPGRGVLAAALGVSALVAAGLSHLASSSPDGLEHVAEQLGMTGRDSATAGLPTADYGISGVGSAFWSGSLAGLLGVAVTVVAVTALAWAVHRARGARRPAPAAERPSVTTPR